MSFTAAELVQAGIWATVAEQIAAGSDVNGLNVTNGKTASVSNSITLAGTDGTTMTFPGVSATIPGVAVANTWTANQTITDANIVLSTNTGTKIGTATGQKLGFWGATPVVQPTVATDATVATLITALTNIGLIKNA